ncbi:MAG: ABC transporter substrate-binding protein [Elusimicrobia bacterium]|nr:ABC transporter substrate-binding protein [Candidatus Liberimonas magnetica]
MKYLAIVLFIFVFFFSTPLYSAETVIACIVSAEFQAYNDAINGFKQSLRDSGITPKLSIYNIKDRGKESVLTDIKTAKPALVLVLGNESLEIAISELSSFPVVFCMVTNYARSNDSATGVLMDITPETRLKEIKKILPGTKNIGILYTSESAASVTKITQAADKLNLTVVAKEVKNTNEFGTQLKSLIEQINCFLILPDIKLYNSQIIKFLLINTIAQKIPVIGLSRFYTKSGALLSIEPDYTSLGKQTGQLANRIIKGESPKNIDIEYPNKIVFSLNQNTAKTIGLTIQDSIIKEAVEVFQQ